MESVVRHHHVYEEVLTVLSMLNNRRAEAAQSFTGDEAKRDRVSMQIWRVLNNEVLPDSTVVADDSPSKYSNVRNYTNAISDATRRHCN